MRRTFFAVWHACSVLICDIIWGCIRVSESEKKGDALSPATIYLSNCCLVATSQGEGRGMQLFNCTLSWVADSLWVRFGYCEKLQKLYLIKEIAFSIGLIMRDSERECLIESAWIEKGLGSVIELSDEIAESKMSRKMKYGMVRLVFDVFELSNWLFVQYINLKFDKT